MLQAIIFDFDGVIADTEKLHLRAFQEVLDRRGIELGAQEYYDRYLGRDDAGVLRALARQCGLAAGDTRVEVMLREKAGRYAELIAGNEVLFDGVEERLRAWCGQVPLAIASGSLRSEIERILGRRDLLACFRAIVSAEDVTRGKPAPDPYLNALDRLNRHRDGRPQGAGPARDRDRIDAHRVVVIEDSVPGIQAARSAGIRTVAVATNHTADALSSADLVVPSVAALDLQTLERLAGFPHPLRRI
jgi:beta-phosphoglucomutase